jgi:hypothetical protein
VTRYLRLPLAFDIDRLQQEVQGIHAHEWIDHFNTTAYEHGWSCVPLRSVGGESRHIMPVESTAFADTAILARCPYVREVIGAFACETTSVRFMALASGACIQPHRDPKTALEDGITRLHIPIQTHPEVLFHIDGEAVHFSAGHTWYLNASCEHAVVNPSPWARVHLMMDCVTNPWLESVFLAAGGVRRPGTGYPDPNIHDGNVLEIIDQLRTLEGAAAQDWADQLLHLHQQRHAGAQA